MKHIQTFQLFEAKTDLEYHYTTEQMDAYVKELADIIPWDDKPGFKKITVNVPRDYNASVECANGKDLLENWEIAKKLSDDKTTWKAWSVDVGGAFNKPTSGKSGYDMDKIMEIVRKRPEAFRRMSIALDNEEKRKVGAAISAEYGQGRNMGD